MGKGVQVATTMKKNRPYFSTSKMSAPVPVLDLPSAGSGPALGLDFRAATPDTFRPDPVVLQGKHAPQASWPALYIIYSLFFFPPLPSSNEVAKNFVQVYRD